MDSDAPGEIQQLQAASRCDVWFDPGMIASTGVADLLGKPISRDVIGALRSFGLIATGPHSPQPGAPYAYVTTPAFLELGGLASLRDLPGLDKLEAAGLLGKAPLPEELRVALGLTSDAENEEVADIDEDIGFGSFQE
jgi:hypothetical protein